MSNLTIGLGKVYKVFDKMRAVIIVAAFSFIVLLCLYQVVARYFGMGLRMFPWGDEVIRMTGIWISFMAASLGVREGAHMSVSILVDSLPTKFRKTLDIIAKLIVLAVMVILVYWGVVYAMSNANSMLLNIRMARAWFYIALPIGAAYMFLEYTILMIYGKHPFVTHDDEMHEREQALQIDQLASGQDLNSSQSD